MLRWLACLAVAAVFSTVSGAGAGAARLICYVGSTRETTGFSQCTHLVYTGNERGDTLEDLLKEYRNNNARLKIILRIAEVDKDLRKLLKSKYIQGLEISDAHRSLNKTMVTEAVEAARKTLSSTGGGPLFLSLPSHPELLAKYYDLRSLVKKVDLMMVQTHNLGLVKKTTYHPSRLSGVWDMMNTDSVVDLVIGLGVPASKIVISLPSSALKFTLQNETLSTPGSPTNDDEPKEINQVELCRMLQKGRWTLERDQDLSAPYAFQDKTWIAFEDASSVDVKGKYARVRGLAGLALVGADEDLETSCGSSLKASLGRVLNQQSRAPRAAVLRSLEHEILSAPVQARALEALQVSPYRITQVVDSDGVIHSIREDTRTEFSCTRQGYFVHPRSCARFYRCVKFDQLSFEYTVFEFDCPSGLAFDSRYEVCVWPGSLPDSQACPGSSEIAPVPASRFVCPATEGYYADPENCRWFFACLDHGKAPLTAYEFRCPFGLGFDARQLKCDWPWLVPECGNIARYEAQAHGFSSAVLTGAVGFKGQTADAINIAAHQSLASGAAANNYVGIQTHALSQQDALDNNFIASQELANIQNSLTNGNKDIPLNGNLGLVQATKYNDEEKYTSGSLILDDYRLPSKPKSSQEHGTVETFGVNRNVYSGSIGNVAQKYLQYNNNGKYEDQSGAYVHDPSGDYAEPYRHVNSPASPYIHQDSGYSDYYDINKYSQGKYDGAYKNQGTYKYDGSYTNDGAYKYEGSYVNNGAYKYDGAYANGNNKGQYVHDNSGNYVSNGNVKSYGNDNSGSYINDNSGQYVAGVYRTDAHIDNQNLYGTTLNNGLNIVNYQGTYGNANAGNYLTDTKAYTGASHTLTNGAVNVGLVGKTTLIDANYNDQANYKINGGYSTSSQTQFYQGQGLHPGHVGIVAQPAVSINHVGTDSQNLDGYEYVTTPAPPVIPSTEAPYAVTSIPVVTSTYHTTYVPQPPKSTIKEVFGVSHPPITYVQPTSTPASVSPSIQVTHYNQGKNYYGETIGQTVESESGYSYNNPTVKFEDGISYSTPAPTVSTYKPQGFGHSQQTLHKVESVGFDYSGAVPVSEEPFKKVVAYTTGEAVPAIAQPTLSTYTPQSISQQTVHSVNDVKYNIQEPKQVQYTTVQTPIAVQPVVSTYQPQYQQTIHNVDVNHINTYTQGESGYEHSKPVVQLEVQNTFQYSTPEPDVSISSGQAYSHQTLHSINTESNSAYDSIKPVITVPQQTVIQYSTPTPEIIPTNNVQSYSEQTIHNSYNQKPFEYNNLQPAAQLDQQKLTVQYSTPATLISTNNEQSHRQQIQHNVQQSYASIPTATVQTYQQPAVSVYQNPIIQFSQKVTPAVTYATPTYTPQSYSQQTYHKVEGSKISLPTFVAVEQQVQYTTNQPDLKVQPVDSNYQPHTYSQQALHQVYAGRVNALVENSGYEYQKPLVKLQETPVQYTTPNPTVTESVIPSQIYSQQTFHKVDANQINTGYEYQKPIAQLEQAQKTIQYSVPDTPNIPVVSTYQPQTYSQQTLHQVDAAQINSYSKDQGYLYKEPEVKLFSQPQVVQYTTPATTVTYQPQTYSQQTLHKVEAARINTYSEDNYEYSKPQVSLHEVPKTVIQYTTPTPATISTYHPETYNQHIVQTVNKIVPVPSTTLPQVEYQQPEVTVYENPILKYKQNVTPKPISTQYETLGKQYYSNVQQQYSQPEIQRNYEQFNNIAKPYSDATLVSQQSFNLGSGIKENAAPLVTVYNRCVSTTPVNFDHYNQYETQKANPFQVQDNNDYKPLDNTQQYDINQKNVQISFRNEQSDNGGSFHLSTFPGTRVVTKYKQTNNFYQPPEIQVGYQAEEYLTPIVSTSAPVVTSSYKPVTISTEKQYLPSLEPVYSTPEYLAPKTEREFLPPSTTVRPVIKSTTPVYVKSTTTQEYLPPSNKLDSRVINYENLGFKSYEQDTLFDKNNPYGEQNTLVQTAKSNLLGFGTVGPDAGLVSPVTYTSSGPVISSSESYTPRPIEPAEITPFSSSGRKIRPRVKPVASTTEPQYRYEESTAQYQAPEYLPPTADEIVRTVPRKHNLVVETAKSSLLGFSTVGPDAGLVSTVSSLTPSEVPSSEKYYTRTTTYAPIMNEFVEVIRPRVQTRPKVAVVTKINDFNPLLVRKLGAVCSCQSPILILKGKRPSIQEVPDYDVDYDQSGRGDISESAYGQKSARFETIVSTVAPVTSSLNPIIVPDDSYYQDFEDSAIEEEDNSRINIKSSTPAYSSTTEKIIRIRPRVKAVTIAPTYQTVIQRQTPTTAAIIEESEAAISSVQSQSFDRYGPGGWRGRDETLQGSVDCQRAGLFRHPKHCNKFYACRWDCTKQRFTLHVFNCPVQLSFDPNLGACNWPSQGPACQGDTLLANAV